MSDSLYEIVLDNRNRLNAIIENSKETQELPSMEVLDVLAKLRVSLDGVSRSLQVQKIIDYIDSLGYLTAGDIYLVPQIIKETHQWVEDYKYKVIYVKWVNEGIPHEIWFNQIVELDEADATLDRNDALVINIDSSTVYKKTGIPGDASLPVLEANELLITPVFVEAGTTQPADATNSYIFRENAEWTTAVISGTPVFDDEHPLNGTYNIKAAGGDEFSLTGSQLVTGTNGLVLNIKLNAQAGDKIFKIKTIADSNGIGYIAVAHGNYGFDAYNTTTWQTLVIPPSVLGLVAGVTLDEVDFYFQSGFPECYIDDIYLQFGGTPPTVSGDYLPRGGYLGTAQDLKDLIDLIGATPGIISLTGDGVDNTDPDNPVMNLSDWQKTSEKGFANGYASLDSGGKVPSGQLPSYVDDVIEYADVASFPATGETGKIYVAQDTNFSYRWTGSVYVKINDIDGATIKTLLFAESDTNNLTDALLAKLSAIRARSIYTNATATGTLNLDLSTYVRFDLTVTGNLTIGFSALSLDADMEGINLHNPDGYTVDFVSEFLPNDGSESFDFTLWEDCHVALNVKNIGSGTELIYYGTQGELAN